MNREGAKKISEQLEESIQNLSASLVIAKEIMTDEEYKFFKKDVGLAIGKISNDIVDPIYKQFPELAPSGVL